jgi:hypothetical protein
MNFAAITLCFASQRVFIVLSIYFVTDSVRKRLDTLSYNDPDNSTAIIKARLMRQSGNRLFVYPATTTNTRICRLECLRHDSYAEISFQHLSSFSVPNAPHAFPRKDKLYLLYGSGNWFTKRKGNQQDTQCWVEFLPIVERCVQVTRIS